MDDRTILGVDPGLQRTGYGVLSGQSGRLRVVEAGVIRSRTAAPLEERLVSIFRGLCEAITAHQPSSVAIEQLYSHYERPRTAILMGHARGAICLAAGQHGLPVSHYAATHVKRLLTGSGRASKGQMQRAVQRELGLPQLPEPPDVADALAIALCHWHALRRPLSQQSA